MPLHYRVGIKHHVMARPWGTDMETEKCISSIWRWPKRKAALWFGVGVSAETVIVKSLIYGWIRGPIIEVMWEQEVACVRLLSHAEPALQSHFRRENESVEFMHTSFALSKLRRRFVMCACVEGAAHVFLQNKSQNTHVVPVVWLLVLRVFVTVIF